MGERISRLSLEFIGSDVTVAADPTGAAPDLAFVAWADDETPGGEPEAGDWVAGTWSGPLAGLDGSMSWTAAALVGPGGAIALDPGRYTVWVRTALAPQVPVRESGVLIVY